MTLNDTVEMMLSEDYKERFLAEYLQLIIRMSSLNNMLREYKAGTLNFTPKCSYDILIAQLRAMELYACFLEDRAKIEDIDLW